MRAVAVLAVVLYHSDLVTGGYVGVDVFFVLSGFLITGLIWDELSSTGSVALGQFYARRARRLLPAALVVLVVTAAASVAVLSPLQARSVLKDAVAAILYSSNYRFAVLETDYLATEAPSPLQHFWSLSLEEQFYLLWPLLIVMGGVGWRWWRRRPPLGGSQVVPHRLRLITIIGTLGAASFAASWRLTSTDQPWAFFSLPTRAWELGAGGLIALTATGLRRVPRQAGVLLGWAGLATVIASIVVFSDTTHFPGIAALAPVLGTSAVLIAGCVSPGTGANRLLTVRPLPSIGRISYGWYLWHWPLLVLGAAAAGRRLDGLESAALVAAGGLLAMATVRLVEEPVRFAPALVRRPRRSVAIACVATATTALLIGVLSLGLPPLQGGTVAAPLQALGGHPPPTTAATVAPDAPLAAPLPSDAQQRVTAAVAAAMTSSGVPMNLTPPLSGANRDRAAPFVDGCSNSYTDAAVRSCVYGDPSGQASIVLFGDSHAAQWFPPLNRLAIQRHWRLVVLTKATCPPLQLRVYSPVLRRPFRECTSWRDSVVQRIAKEQPLLVVLGAARHYDEQYGFDVFSPEWLDGLATMVSQVAATGPSTLVLGPTPKPAVNVPDCLSRHLRTAGACTTGTTTAVSATGAAAERRAVTAAGGSYVDISSWLCTADQCAAIVANLLVFRDDNHLTTSYTDWLTPLLAQEIDLAVSNPAPLDKGTLQPTDGAQPAPRTARPR